MRTAMQPDWLVLAEKEFAAEAAERRASDKVWAATLAESINDGLAALGITPIEPAKADGHGKLIPAKLTNPDFAHKLYGVYASWDEEEGCLSLLVTALAHPDQKADLKEAKWSLRGCTAAQARRLIVLTRREGPAPEPPKSERPSADALIVEAALRDVVAALDNAAFRSIQPL